jgi:hypothetical protein
MKRNKLKFIPVTGSCEQTLELNPIPVAGSCEPTVELKFLPPVTLSYESTLELKPIPVTVNAEEAGEAGKGTVKRMTRAVRTARQKKGAAAGAKARTLSAKKAKAKRKGA